MNCESSVNYTIIFWGIIWIQFLIWLYIVACKFVYFLTLFYPLFLSGFRTNLFVHCFYLLTYFFQNNDQKTGLILSVPFFAIDCDDDDEDDDDWYQSTNDDWDWMAMTTTMLWLGPYFVREIWKVSTTTCLSQIPFKSKQSLFLFSFVSFFFLLTNCPYFNC